MREVDDHPIGVAQSEDLLRGDSRQIESELRAISRCGELDVSELRGGGGERSACTA
jgi:hypothetical protein